MLSIDSYKPPQQIEILQTVSQLIHDKKITIKSIENYDDINHLYQAFKKNVTFDSKNMELSIRTLVTCFESTDISLNELGLVTVVFDNIILQTDEIYLKNQIKHFFKTESVVGSLGGFVGKLYNFLADCVQLINSHRRNQLFVDFFVRLVQCLRKITGLPSISLRISQLIVENSNGKNVAENFIKFNGAGEEQKWLMVSFLVELDVDCLEIIAMVDEDGLGERMRDFVIGKLCDKMVSAICFLNYGNNLTKNSMEFCET